jgi:hypothetical protein
MSTAVEPLARGRATIDQRGRELTIRIPAKRILFVVAFLAFWMVAWSVGLASAVGSLGGDVGETVFLVGWLGAWIVAGGAVLLVIAWSLAGREEVGADAGRLVTARVLGPWRRARTFAARDVRDLRVATSGWNPWDFRSVWAFWGLSGGSIAFDYGARTHRFGAALDEAEAKQLIPRIEAALRA